MHVLNFDTRVVKVVLEPSVGYKGPVSEEKYVIVQLGLDPVYVAQGFT